MGVGATISVKETGNSDRNYSLDGDLDGELTLKELLEYTKKSLIRISQDALKEEQGKGFDKDPLVFVDSKKGVPLQLVSPLGKIEFVSKFVSSLEILSKAFDLLIKKSKVITGLYYDSHYVFKNYQLVATTRQELLNYVDSKPSVSEGDVFQIINVVPYARRLERLGVTVGKSKTKLVSSRDRWKRSGPKVLAENGVYVLTSRALIREYGKNARIKFSLISGNSIGSSNLRKQDYAGRGLRTHFKPKKKGGKSSGPYIYPAITIVLNGGTT